MLKHNVGLIHNLSWLHVHREYSRLEARDSTIPPLKTWLRCRCAALADKTDNERAELWALSVGPSKRACSFKSMTSFGSHYRVDLEEADTQHITFDSGVAELGSRRGGPNTADNCAVVDLIRVGILKDILVVNYGKFPIVLMAVSWLAKHTTHQPRMQRDAYGFWLANMAAIPRDVSEPYILPALASQVRRMLEDVLFIIDVSFQTTIGIVHHRQLHNMYVQVFFVNDKSMPGWCVVVKKGQEDGEYTQQKWSIFLVRKSQAGIDMHSRRWRTEGGTRVMRVRAANPQSSKGPPGGGSSTN